MLRYSPKLHRGNLKEQMVFVEGGEFKKRLPDNSGESSGTSMLVNDFYICRLEVTQELWQEVCGDNGSAFKHPEKPVERVSWYDAIKFCNLLSELEGLPQYYLLYKGNSSFEERKVDQDSELSIIINPDANGFRLPWSDEWEFAAYGGKYFENPYISFDSFNLNEVSWHNVGLGNSSFTSQPVGLNRPNILGLYDMIGNVREWCQDSYNEEVNYSMNQEKLLDTKEGRYRVLHGGAWDERDSAHLQVSFRFKNIPDFRYDNRGFRIAQNSNANKK